jgi:uncharacterized protein
MAELRNFQQTGTRSATSIDQGLRSYMLGVYNYMALGIAATAVIVLATYMVPAIHAISPILSMPAMIGLFALGWFGPRMVYNGSIGKAHAIYWLYVACWGFGIAPIVHRYLGVDPTIVFKAFLSAAVTFGGMSLWGYTSKRDLTSIGSFAVMGLWGLFVAAIINVVIAMFTGVGAGAIMFSTLISAGFVVLVAVLTAWETQSIKEMYVEGNDNNRNSIMGAFMLYGSFVSIFVNILQILGFMRSE